MTSGWPPTKHRRCSASSSAEMAGLSALRTWTLYLCPVPRQRGRNPVSQKAVAGNFDAPASGVGAARRGIRGDVPRSGRVREIVAGRQRPMDPSDGPRRSRRSLENLARGRWHHPARRNATLVASLKSLFGRAGSTHRSLVRIDAAGGTLSTTIREKKDRAFLRRFSEAGARNPGDLHCDRLKSWFRATIEPSIARSPHHG